MIRRKECASPDLVVGVRVCAWLPADDDLNLAGRALPQLNVSVARHARILGSRRGREGCEHDRREDHQHKDAHGITLGHVHLAYHLAHPAFVVVAMSRHADTLKTVSYCQGPSCLGLSHHEVYVPRQSVTAISMRSPRLLA